MQYIEIFEKFIEKKNDIFNILAQNIDYVNMLEPPRQGGSICKQLPTIYVLDLK